MYQTVWIPEHKEYYIELTRPDGSKDWYTGQFHYSKRSAFRELKHLHTALGTLGIAEKTIKGQFVKRMTIQL